MVKQQNNQGRDLIDNKAHPRAGSNRTDLSSPKCFTKTREGIEDGRRDRQRIAQFTLQIKTVVHDHNQWKSFSLRVFIVPP